LRIEELTRRPCRERPHGVARDDDSVGIQAAGHDSVWLAQAVGIAPLRVPTFVLNEPRRTD
jgi:hypothetical protein